MSKTDKDFNINIQELLNFDIKCAYVNCENNSKWICIILCCSNANFHCPGHRILFEERVKDCFKNKKILGSSPTCTYCGSKPKSEEEYYRYEAL